MAGSGSANAAQDACASRASCSQHGVCVQGACICNTGWQGADCSAPLLALDGEAAPDSSLVVAGALAYGSIGVGIALVLIVCLVYCYFDRKALRRKYQVRMLDEASEGMGAQDDDDVESHLSERSPAVPPRPPGAAAGAGAGENYVARKVLQREGGHSPGVDTLESFVPDGEEDEGMDSLEAKGAGQGFVDGLDGTRLQADLEYLRKLPDLRMPRLPGIRAVVEIDGQEISFRPGEDSMRRIAELAPPLGKRPGSEEASDSEAVGLDSEGRADSGDDAGDGASDSDESEKRRRQSRQRRR